MSGRAERGNTHSTRRLNLRRILALIFIALVVIFLLPALLCQYVVPDAFNGWWFIAQTLAGNWSPPDHRPGGVRLSNYWFVFVAEAAILLNFGPYLVFIDLLRRVVKIEKEQAMQLKQVFNERDSAIIAVLLSTVPEGQRDAEENRLSELFEAGHNLWQKLVATGHDPQEAARIIAAIDAAKFEPD